MRDRKFSFHKPRFRGHQVAVWRAGHRGWHTWPTLLVKNQQQALDLCRQINDFIMHGKPIGPDLDLCMSVMAFGPGYSITDNRKCSNTHDFVAGDHVRLSDRMGVGGDLWDYGTGKTAKIVERHGGILYTVSRRGDQQEVCVPLWSYQGVLEVVPNKPIVRGPPMDDDMGDLPF
jgi:hypothetical protein